MDVLSGIHFSACKAAFELICFFPCSYVPDLYVNKQGELTDRERIEINNLNAELVHKLKAQDTAFSTGKCLTLLCAVFAVFLQSFSHLQSARVAEWLEQLATHAEGWWFECSLRCPSCPAVKMSA